MVAFTLNGQRKELALDSERRCFGRCANISN